MGTKVYLLLDIKNNSSTSAIRTLQGIPGVKNVDVLEGPPDIMVQIEADKSKQLIQKTIRAIAAVEHITEEICLLPVKNNLDSITPS